MAYSRSVVPTRYSPGTGPDTLLAESFNNFNDHMTKVLRFAREEAQRLNHKHMGTEHLLLGLMREQEGVGPRVLSQHGVTHERVQQAVQFIIGRSDADVAGDVRLTPRASQVLELARDHARELDHDYVGTEHLLLGLLREGEGVAVGILQSVGVNLERIWANLFRVLGIPPGQRPELPWSHRWRDGTVQALRQRLERRQLWSIHGYSQVVRPLVGLSSLAPAAIRAIEEAELSAWWLNHPKVGTGHLLLGLIREHQGIAARALRELNVTQDLVVMELERLLPRGKPMAGAAIEMSSPFQRVLEAAHDIVGPYGGVTPYSLTPRELEVGHLLAIGASNKEVAAVLVLEIASVKSQPIASSATATLSTRSVRSCIWSPVGGWSSVDRPRAEQIPVRLSASSSRSQHRDHGAARG
jgi:ATP-dependent Clp protease ATP-binding subunit ClpA